MCWLVLFDSDPKMPKLPEKLFTAGGYEVQIPKFLIGLFLPLISRKNSAKNGRGKYPRIEVAGASMRIGKTTLIRRVLVDRLIQLGIPVLFSPEDWRNNPHLRASYQDQAGRSQALKESQKWFAKRKFDQLSKPVDKAVFIQDVSPLMDLGYAVTNAVLEQMLGGDFEQYLASFQRLAWKQVLAPDLTIFLDASDDVLLQRAEKSRRPFETFDQSYILTMAAINGFLINSAPDQDSILHVETDNNNFARDEEVQDWLFSLIVKELIKRDWSEMEQLLV